MAESLLVISTFDSVEAARKAANALVDERLAACANLIPQLESIYRWKGQVETASEIMVLFKTTRDRYPQFEQRLRSLHPYEVPEIVAIELTTGLPAYLQWLADSVS